MIFMFNITSHLSFKPNKNNKLWRSEYIKIKLNSQLSKVRGIYKICYIKKTIFVLLKCFLYPINTLLLLVAVKKAVVAFLYSS